MLLQTSFFVCVCVVFLPLHGTNACVKAINGKRWHLRDRAIFIGGMGPLQNSMGRLLFSVTFKHGANTFFSTNLTPFVVKLFRFVVTCV